MNEFFDSKFIDDLKAGKLPQVEVTVPDESLVKIFAGTFFTAVAIIITAALVRKFL